MSDTKDIDEVADAIANQIIGDDIHEGENLDEGADPEQNTLPPREGLQNETGQIRVDAKEKLLSMKSFEEMNLPKDILENIYNNLHFARPSLIQAEAIPYILKGKSMLGQAINGSGKTVCFLLGMICTLDRKKFIPQCLCLVPSRELAIQTDDVLQNLLRGTGITSRTLIDLKYGGPIKEQIIISTVGTLMKSLENGQITMKFIKLLVFDEADTFAADQLQNNLAFIFQQLSESTQCLLFSATFPEDVRKWADYLVPDGIKLQKEAKDLTLETVTQFFIQCPEGKKDEVIDELYTYMTIGQTMIFVNTKKKAGILTKFLRGKGHTVGLLSGDLSKEERDKVMLGFRRNEIKVLVVTNIISRGIDVDTVTLVINYELPIKYQTKKIDLETYLHRVGRTGRMGKKGAAINLVENQLEKDHLAVIYNYYQSNMIELSRGDPELCEKKIKDAMKRE